MLRQTLFQPLLLSILLAGAAYAQSPKPAATVDGVAITEDDIKTAGDDIAAGLQQMGDEQKRKYIVEYIIDLRLLARAAEKQKMADNADFVRKIAYLKDRALMEGLMTKAGADAVSPEKMKAFYDEAVKGLTPEKEVRARHILVEQEDDAKKIQARLKGGEDFAKVAAELSKDPGSGKDGGDLGYFTKDRMVPEFAEAAFKMKPGEISEPVKSQFGWHVIKVEDVRSKEVPPLDQVKEELGRYLTQKGQQELIMKLRADAKIERLEEPKAPDAKAPEAAPAAPTPAEPKK